ncbi:hypothetical protein [Rhodococcus zopfii]|uniref:hypothetical protein n=1 Tax=Rhodococcus zopfii TaxID=43772 RepID=UPI0009336D78|nr:hypothetical protein [Rhodococcus zopfii]
MNAQEYCTDPQAPGLWEPWRWVQPAMLVGIGISDAGVDVKRINPSLHDLLWTKFQRLRVLWQSHHDVSMADVLSPLRPHHLPHGGRTKPWSLSTWVQQVPLHDLSSSQDENLGARPHC